MSTGLPYGGSLVWALNSATGLYEPIACTQVGGAFALDVNIVGGGGSGGTSSNFGAAFPSQGTAIGLEQSGLMVALVEGQAIMASSVPVVIASDQSAIPVSGSFSVAPTYSHTINSQGQLTVGITAIQVLAQNLSRTRFIIKQDGTTKIYLLYGGVSPTNSNYTDALAAGGTSHDGSIPKIDDNQWQGSVWAISSAIGGSLLFTEFE